jgi:phosphoglycolate phosphatase-like HAD superfamily hydrolase
MEKLVIIDFDGVTADSKKRRDEFLFYLCQKYKKPCPARIIMENLQNNDHYPSHYGMLGFDWEKEKEMIWDEYKRYNRENPPEIFEGVIQSVDEIKKAGITVALVTLNSRELVLPWLKRNGIENLFPFMATVETRKNKRDLFDFCAGFFHMRKENIIAVDDALEHIKLAKEMGMTALAAGYGGYHSAELLLEEVGPSRFIEYPHQISGCVFRNL